MTERERADVGQGLHGAILPPDAFAPLAFPGGRQREGDSVPARAFAVWGDYARRGAHVGSPERASVPAHLLGEHRELHAIWAVLTGDKAGYRHHPETLRWEGRLAALYARHSELVGEMWARGYPHASPLDPRLATSAAVQDRYVDPPNSKSRSWMQSLRLRRVTRAVKR